MPARLTVFPLIARWWFPATDAVLIYGANQEVQNRLKAILDPVFATVVVGVIRFVWATAVDSPQCGAEDLIAERGRR